jgi:LmbE family N-acetylglucosaminyl deacetylase/2-polyprenyl-3-methyl-5-hydroxy-6-metoxy-1,4-benzoquinol methylase
MVTQVRGHSFDASAPGTDAEQWRRAMAGSTRPPLTLDGVRRIVVVGAHPDDESLGSAGLVAGARDAGIDVDLVCVTDGAGSHPGSPTLRPGALARRRRAEWMAAADLLGVDVGRRHFLDLPDGHAAEHADEITAALVDLVGQGTGHGTGTVLVAPWRYDGHPDHEAVGVAAAATARRTDAELWEFPVWFWHWAGVDDPRAELLRPWPLGPGARSTKRAAVASHRSQVEALSEQPGDERLLSEEFRAHFAGDREWFVVTASANCVDDALDQLHDEVADPWGVDVRWFERRKRDLVLAMLPRARFRRSLELGCSTGALTARIADRSDAVVAVDSSATAIRAARCRLASRPEVDLEVLDLRTAWPLGSFDLVVVSEVGYFLSPATLERVVSRVASCLDRDGVVVLCHWRHQVAGWLLTADDVHRAFRGRSLPPLRATYRDDDVEIRVLARSWPEHDR